MWIREAVAGDAGPLAQVFYAAVQAADGYSPAQRNAWCDRAPAAQDWADRLSGLITLVAVDAGPLGFVSLRGDDGYLDLAFVDPAHAGKGVFSQLDAVAENRARSRGLRRMHTQASLMLHPILLAKGWTVLRPNTVTRNGQSLQNFIMEKPLQTQA